MRPEAHLLVDTRSNQVKNEDEHPQLTWCFPEHSCLSITVVQHPMESTKHKLSNFSLTKILLWARQTDQQLECLPIQKTWIWYPKPTSDGSQPSVTSGPGDSIPSVGLCQEPALLYIYPHTGIHMYI